MVVEARYKAIQANGRDPDGSHKPSRQLLVLGPRPCDSGFLASPDELRGVFWMGTPHQEETTLAQAPYAHSFDHEGMVRSNSYCDDNARFISTVHVCNTSLDHGQTLLLSTGMGVAVGGAGFVRPRRHRVCNIWLMSHVSTADAL